MACRIGPTLGLPGYYVGWVSRNDAEVFEHRMVRRRAVQTFRHAPATDDLGSFFIAGSGPNIPLVRRRETSFDAVTFRADGTVAPLIEGPVDWLHVMGAPIPEVLWGYRSETRELVWQQPNFRAQAPLPVGDGCARAGLYRRQDEDASRPESWMYVDAEEPGHALLHDLIRTREPETITVPPVRAELALCDTGVRSPSLFVPVGLTATVEYLAPVFEPHASDFSLDEVKAVANLHFAEGEPVCVQELWVTTPRGHGHLSTNGDGAYGWFIREPDQWADVVCSGVARADPLAPIPRRSAPTSRPRSSRPTRGGPRRPSE